ncbi:MAG: hypothetical protein ACE5GU_05360 [Candidatus Scalinduaceae bacterium]
MQKATSAITFPHFFLPISAYISEANHTSITSRFKSNETSRYTHQISWFSIILLFAFYIES